MFRRINWNLREDIIFQSTGLTWRILLLLFFSYSFVHTADLSAQIGTATLTGRVIDAAGLSVTGATVRLQNVGTGLERTSESVERGWFRFEFIPPARYLLQASAPGFSTLEDSLILHVGDLLEVDITLLRFFELEGQVIEAERPRTTSLKSGISSVTTEEELNRLPYRKREYQNLAILTPGVKRGSISGINVFDLDVVSVSGRDGSNVAYSVDGVDNNEYSAGLPAVEFPQEAIQEYQVGSHRFGAEYGGSAGGFINVLTRSGTNDWKGSFFTYMKNEGLMDRDYFMKGSGVSKPDLFTNQFGVSLGGPIIEDRTHLFAAYEGTRGEDEFLTVNTGGAFLENEGSYSRPVREDLLFFKVDHSFSPRKLLTVRYNQQNSLMKLLDTGGATTLESARWEDLDRYAVTAKYDWFHSPGLSTQIKAYYGWYRRNSGARNPDSAVLFFPSAFLGSNTYAPFEHRAQKLGAGGALSLNGLGEGKRHNVKTGFDFDRVTTDLIISRGQIGLFGYSADDPESTPLFFRYSLGDSAVDMHRNVLSAYGEDDYQVTDRLNLFLGLRYDLETGILTDYSLTPAAKFIRDNYPELKDKLRDYFPELDLNDGYRTMVPAINNLAPRLCPVSEGFGQGGRILKGGWGLYYDSVYDLFLTGILPQNSARPRLSYIIPRPGFDPDSIPDLGDTYDPTGKGSNVSMLSPALRTPYTHQSSIGAIFRLTEDASLEVDYVNSLGRSEIKQRNINFKESGERILTDELGDIIVLESIGLSRYDALLLELKNTFGGNVKTSLAYTLSRTNSTQEGFNTRPQDNLNPLAAVEFGPTGHDATHSLTASVMSRFLKTIEVNMVIHVESPRPYTRFTGLDENGDGLRNDIAEGYHRNSERGDWTFQWDVRFSKSFHYGKWGSSELLVDVLNITNTANFGNFYFDTLTSDSFGQPRRVFTPPRQVQIGLRHTF